MTGFLKSVDLYTQVVGSPTKSNGSASVSNGQSTISNGHSSKSEHTDKTNGHAEKNGLNGVESTNGHSSSTADKLSKFAANSSKCEENGASTNGCEENGHLNGASSEVKNTNGVESNGHGVSFYNFHLMLRCLFCRFVLHYNAIDHEEHLINQFKSPFLNLCFLQVNYYF